MDGATGMGQERWMMASLDPTGMGPTKTQPRAQPSLHSWTVHDGPWLTGHVHCMVVSLTFSPFLHLPPHCHSIV